jgi:hypothetical protein
LFCESKATEIHESIGTCAGKARTQITKSPAESPKLQSLCRGWQDFENRIVALHDSAKDQFEAIVLQDQSRTLQEQRDCLKWAQGLFINHVQVWSFDWFAVASEGCLWDADWLAPSWLLPLLKRVPGIQAEDEFIDAKHKAINAQGTQLLLGWYAYVLSLALDPTYRKSVADAPISPTEPRIASALLPRPAIALKPYQSRLKRYIRNYLTDKPNATAREVCGYVDEQALDGCIPKGWLKDGNRELTVAYKTDPTTRGKIAVLVSKIKLDLKSIKAS